MTTKLLSRNVLMGMLYIALTFLFATSLHSCTDEQTQNPTPNGEENTITFSVKLPRGFTPATYALDEDDENAINTIDVLLFKQHATDENERTFVSGPHYGAIVIDPTDNSKADVTVRIPEASGTVTYDMVILANCREKLDDDVSSFNDTKTKEEILSALTLTLPVSPASGWITDTGDDNYIPMPMWAETSVTVTGTSATPASSGDVNLIRMLARINVANKTTGDSFTLTRIELYNRNTVGRIAPKVNDNTVWDVAKNEAKTPSLPTSSGKQEGPLSYSGLDIEGGNDPDDNAYLNEIYTFEAKNGTGTTLNTNPCIVIGGTYDSETYYYRIDFTKESSGTVTYLDLLRNYSYDISIEKINGPGYATANEAFKSTPVNIQYNVKAWNDIAIAEDDYTKRHSLVPSPTKFAFDAAVRDEKNGDNILSIETDYSKGWTADITCADGGSWLSLIEMDGSAINISELQTATHVKLKLEANDTGSPRAAVIKLRAGGSSYSVSVGQSEVLNNDRQFRSEAAFYGIFNGGEKVFIPVSRANAYPKTDVQLGASDVFTVDWEPKSSIIKAVKPVGVGSSGQVYIETGTGSGEAEVFIEKGGVEICRWNVLVSEPEANSYIVQNGQTIYIPVSQVSKFEEALQTLPNNDGVTYIADAGRADTWFDDDGAFETDWLWKDQDDLTVSATPIGIGTNGYVKVTVGGSATNGNTVLAVMQDSGDGNGKLIRWSWHIWVSSEIPAVKGSKGFMDRNLGATSNEQGDIGAFGLYYQWGRKDPFPGPSEIDGDEGAGKPNPPLTKYNKILDNSSLSFKKISIVNSPLITTDSDFILLSRLGSNNNVDYSVANPHTFYCAEDATGNALRNWYTTGLNTPGATGHKKQNDNLWGGFTTYNNLNEKTVFDPCPSGWRVPTIITGWATAANGEGYNTWGTTTTPFGTANDYLKSDPYIGNSEHNGYSHDSGWYPAAGYLNYANGIFGVIGSGGYYWSASPYSASHRATGLLIFGTSLNPIGMNSRALGVSIRCVQDQ